MSKETVKVVEIDTNPAVKSLKELRKELLGYKNEMANLEEGGDAFLEVAKKAGEVKHQIDEINESIKGASADFGDMLGNITNVAAGLTGAFQTVAGGLQAIGVRSEAIDEAIAKMQGLMAVTQGLGAIDTAIKSLDKLRKSITSTTAAANLLKTALQPKVFLAISAVIGTLTVLFSKYNKAQEEALAVQEEYNKKLEEERKIRKETETQKYLDNLNTELRIKKEIAGIKFGDNDLEYQKELLKAYREEWKDLLAEAKFYNDGNSKIGEDRLAELNKRIEAIKKISQLIAETETEIRVLEAVEKARKEVEGGKPKPKVEPLTELSPTTPEKLEVPVAVVVSPDEMEESLKNAIEKGLQQLAENDYNSIEERVRRLGNAIFEDLATTTQLLSESSLGISSNWIQSLMEFQEVFNMTMDVIKNNGKNTWNDYANLAVTALAGVGTMLNALSNEQDASDKEGFERTKKLQIAATVMNMLSGIMAAWTSAMSPSNAWMTLPGQIAMGTATSAMIGTIGGIQIDKIKSQTMQSANPNTNINAKAVYGNLIAPVQYSSAVQGASTEGSIKNQKVVVLESDITNTVNKVIVQEEENTY